MGGRAGEGIEYRAQRHSRQLAKQAVGSLVRGAHSGWEQNGEENGGRLESGVEGAKEEGTDMRGIDGMMRVPGRSVGRPPGGLW